MAWFELNPFTDEKHQAIVEHADSAESVILQDVWGHEDHPTRKDEDLGFPVVGEQASRVASGVIQITSEAA